MRTQLTFSITAIALIFSLAFVSCDDNNSNQQPRAHTEQDFVLDPDLTAHPDRKVVFVELEPETAEESANLTGDLGLDIIPFNYTETTNQTLCWEDPQLDSEHMMKLFDSEGQELATVIANGECTTITLLPGRHEMHLFHDNRSGDFIPVFIKPNVLENETAKLLPKSEGLMNKILRFFSMLDTSGISQAQSPTPSPTELSNFTKFISTGVCSGCDLRYTIINVSEHTFNGCANINTVPTVILNDADLTGASLNGFLWCYADLTGAILSKATLNNNIFLFSSFSGVDFSYSTQTLVNYKDSDMSPNNGAATNFWRATVDNSNFQGVIGFRDVGFVDATLTNCDFTGLDLTKFGQYADTDFTGSNLTMTNLSNSVMVDVNFNDVLFEQANLSGFACVNCTFTGANFESANVQGMHIDATGAIWTDGSCVCQDAGCSNC